VGDKRPSVWFYGLLAVSALTQHSGETVTKNTLSYETRSVSIDSTALNMAGGANSANSSETEFKWWRRRSGPVGYDPVGYEPVGYEPVGYDPVGYDPVGYEPVGYDPVGYESVGYDPVGYPVGYESVGYDPVGYYPVGYEPVGYELVAVS